MIDIQRAGLLTTVQDLGRPRQREFGVASGGAVDPLACAVANRLVGNDLSAATLEITMGTCVMRFSAATLVALTGADCHADLDGTPVWSWWRFPVARGQTLTLRPARFGMRTYLAVAGGVDVPETLGSRSTDLAAGFGGFEGRALHDGDRIAIGRASAAVRHVEPLGVRPPLWLSDPLAQRVRVLPGPEYDDFTAATHKSFWENPWQVTPNSNRMGYRLAGPEPLTRKKNRSHDLLSHGVLPGVIQVPPSGQPIILLADAQTTGGYPKIGTVISADLWRLGQARLGSTLYFSECSAAEAREALREQLRYLAQIERALAWHDRGILTTPRVPAITRKR
ncbi:biotin-dependent carboxyltransferase family protein [Pandoraea apista]|uniref:Allophanate hydrolase, subunit2 (Ahs2) n=2 Tax=Pandoraea apista TaxID=93218 RepID=A0A0G4JF71_9BURK|nr:biotin-dependent carboxyltransferase family protein [Pandoraea apista]ALS66015.1 allophanate hydrolase [Pandoraea apista]OXS95444.1 allophanate hydrolase [Pandoraea apista]RRW95522.1 biotin-dependent carboxyltransferase family protein [Pandoraea apista]CFB62115.1 KipI antagonist [Pandoraea apista]VVG69599.1 allophanate hydrolase, subunit2 (ahs2) [Pandoraea apista]